LRLVNADVAQRQPVVHPGHARARVEHENRAAATLAATDARWVLAVRTASLLEGGRAAVLAPERRRRLLALASQLGLRPFDANLVIAIVQDGARSGEGPLGHDVAGRLTLVRGTGARRPSVGPAVAWAIGLALVLAYALVSWLLNT
jgi:hypothetical protein